MKANAERDTSCTDKKKKFKKCLLVLLASGFLGCYWLLFIAVQKGFDEVVVEDGKTSFTAAFADVSYIIPANNDVSLTELLDENDAGVTIEILNSEGQRVGTAQFSDSLIHTNGYNSTENISESGLPLRLNPGETYEIRYEGSCAGQKLTHLSFVLYGNDFRMWWQSGAVFLCAAAAAAGVWLVLRHGREEKGPGVIFVWIGIAGLFLLSAPKMEEMPANRNAFASAYALSNSMMGRPQADENGYVYIDESGLRNMGYTSYSVPMNRFWTDWDYGNLRENGKISSLYRLRSESGEELLSSVLAPVDAVMITAARLARAPWQMVYLSGILLHAALALIFYMLTCRLVSGRQKECGTMDQIGQSREFSRIPLMMLLPSMMQSTMSYLPWGVLAAVLIYVFTLAFSSRVYCVRKPASGFAEGKPHSGTSSRSGGGGKTSGINLILAVSAGIIVFCLFRYGGESLGRAAASAVRDSDSWMKGIVFTFRLNEDAMQLLTVIFLLMVLFLWIRSIVSRGTGNDEGNNEEKKTGRGIVRHVNEIGTASQNACGRPDGKAIAALVLTDMAILMTGVLSGNAGASGVMFLPVALIPLQRDEKPVKTNALSDRLAAVCVFLILYAGLKCLG